MIFDMYPDFPGRVFFRQLDSGYHGVFLLLDHKSAILGDAGINAKVPADFWDSIMKNMVANCSCKPVMFLY